MNGETQLKQPTSRSSPLRVTTIVVIVAVIGLAVFGARVLLQRREAKRVAILGDSITSLSEGALHQTLDSNYQLDIDAIPGIRSDEMIDDSERLAAATPDQAIVFLGTNDFGNRRTPDQTVGSLATVAQTFATSRCIHLVTLNENAVSFDRPEIGGWTLDVNARIKALAAQKGYRVIDWAAIVRDYMAAGEPQGSISTDTVHPTELGSQFLANAYRSSLDSC